MENLKYFLLLLTIMCLITLCACKKNNKPTEQTSNKTEEEGINWLTLQEAQKAMKENPKGGLMIMVHANWCPKCAEFEATTYKNSKVIKEINQFFYPVKLNAQHPNDLIYNGNRFSNPNYDHSKTLEDMNTYHELLYEIEAKSIPSLVFIDSNYEIKGSEMGYKEAEDLRSYLYMYK